MPDGQDLNPGVGQLALLDGHVSPSRRGRDGEAYPIFEPGRAPIDRAIPRDHQPDAVTQPGQLARESPCHIGKSTRLCEWDRL